MIVGYVVVGYVIIRLVIGAKVVVAVARVNEIRDAAGEEDIQEGAGRDLKAVEVDVRVGVRVTVRGRHAVVAGGLVAVEAGDTVA